MASSRERTPAPPSLNSWRHRLTVADYHRMGETNVLSEDIRVELIDGELTDMPPIGSRHAGIVNRISNLLTLAAQGKAIVATQNPITLGEHNEPQPDIALLRPRDDYYMSANPGPGDVFLVVEVADASLDYDRDIKIPLYARFRVSEAWLIDLQNRRLVVFLKPGRDGYEKILRPSPPRQIAPSLLPTAVIDLSNTFG